MHPVATPSSPPPVPTSPLPRVEPPLQQRAAPASTRGSHEAAEAAEEEATVVEAAIRAVGGSSGEISVGGESDRPRMLQLATWAAAVGFGAACVLGVCLPTRCRSRKRPARAAPSRRLYAYATVGARVPNARR